MSGALSRLQNPLGPGVPLPGDQSAGAGLQAPGPPVRGPGPGMGMTPPGPTGGGGGDPLGQHLPRNHAEMAQVLKAEHGRAKAAVEQTGKALGSLDHIRKGLERLADKGDVVSHEDVIHEAGRLVAHGIDPMSLASVLADMPQQGGGEALSAWVTQHAVEAAQAEQQVAQIHAVARHQLANSAMHQIMGLDIGARLGGPPPTETADGGNALGGGGTAPAPGGPGTDTGNALTMGGNGGNQA